MGKTRLDVYLVEKGFAQSRTHAQELIEAGQVFLNEGSNKKVLKKSSFSVDANFDGKITVELGPANRYVSRGGLKLEGALKHVGLSVQGLKALDVGISTGGFTDCLLQSGAEFVLGVDVGHGQVSLMLKDHPRLKVLEGINARALSSEEKVLALTPPEKFDLIVMDVSFISIELIIPELASFLKPTGHLLSLVKPQFEVGVDGLSKGGIVKDVSLYPKVEEKIKSCCQQHHFEVKDYFASSIEGKDGNHEFFVFAKKS
ncbi:TlyA family RNA methyltransferase [Bdellovibrio sp. NC01]|uniref:TlyA family RNA methyltransferase n=1 Tax=Bdellovibrio sp. NC01 TaxID=2220073 RepID=UPI00115BD3FB|nr:TlyA family RNA methyltransferase [Bdellovibrio sp. NC01]QDK36249.1 TlyA family rRNA (cytidine-2'-O)-methyltransferase [Bdellovibrio sp. NC01]